MTTHEFITVEVVYASPDNSIILPVKLPDESTVQQAIEASGIIGRVPKIDLQENKVGIYGKVCKLDHKLRNGDRIEIYRPLIADPKSARKKKTNAGEA